MHRLWILAGALVGLAAVLIGAAVAYTRHSARPAPLAQSTPDGVIDAAFDLVAQGRPGRLAELIYAPDDDMRLVLASLSRLLESVHALSVALRERFPNEIETLRADASTRPNAAGAAMWLSNTTGATSAGAGGGGPPTAMLRTFMADPFGALTGARERVSTVMIADDMAAILVDGRPALGVGLTMRYDADKWWVELPLGLPVVERYAPQTPEEHQILAAMIQVIDNAIVELTGDVRRGKARDLDDAAQLAGQKAFGPIMICVVAYNRVMELRSQAGR